MALLGLAPHRAQGRGGELALDVLHVTCAAFALPSRCLRAALLQPCAAPRGWHCGMNPQRVARAAAGEADLCFWDLRDPSRHHDLLLSQQDGLARG